jgi:hypothetical protein
MRDLGDASARLHDSLGTEGFSRVAAVRRKVWEHGAYGLLSGCSLGFACVRAWHNKQTPATTAALFRERRNREVAATLLAGAALSFLGARAGGSLSFSELGDLWPTRDD